MYILVDCGAGSISEAPLQVQGFLAPGILAKPVLTFFWKRINWGAWQVSRSLRFGVGGLAGAFKPLGVARDDVHNYIILRCLGGLGSLIGSESWRPWVCCWRLAGAFAPCCQHKGPQPQNASGWRLPKTASFGPPPRSCPRSVAGRGAYGSGAPSTSLGFCSLLHGCLVAWGVGFRDSGLGFRA